MKVLKLSIFHYNFFMVKCSKVNTSYDKFFKNIVLTSNIFSRNKKYYTIIAKQGVIYTSKLWKIILHLFWSLHKENK